MKRTLFLYVELTGYMVACLNRLANNGVEVHVIYYKSLPKVPYIIEFESIIKSYCREKYSQKQLNTLVEEIAPIIIFCSGWIDSGYLLTISRFSSKSKTVLMLDSVWQGSVRQQVGALLFRIIASRWFSNAWVPSVLCDEFLDKIGFVKKNTLYELYCADDTLFNTQGHSDDGVLRFIFAGRHDDEKGLDVLLEAYSRYRLQTTGKLAALHVYGAVKRIYPNSEGVEFLGFIQPIQLAQEFKRGGVVVVPSRYDPWGVIVQEALNCGLFVIASDRVGAAALLIEKGQNGNVFKSNDVNDLACCLSQANFEQGNKLLNLAAYSQDNWVQKVIQLL